MYWKAILFYYFQVDRELFPDSQVPSLNSRYKNSILFVLYIHFSFVTEKIITKCLYMVRLCYSLVFLLFNERLRKIFKHDKIRWTMLSSDTFVPSGPNSYQRWSLSQRIIFWEGKKMKEYTNIQKRNPQQGAKLQKGLQSRRMNLTSNCKKV